MLVTAAMVLLALAAVGFFRFHRSKVPPAPLPVASVVAPEITLTGTIQDAHVVNVPVPVDGAVDQFVANVGQHVSEGQVLARIRNPRFAAALQMAKLDAEQAQNHLSQLESALIAARLEVSRSEADAMRVKSDLDQAEKAFDRQQTMFREGVTPRLAYEKAEREYNSLNAAAQNLATTAKNAADRVDSTTKELDPARKALAQKTSDLEDAEAEMAVGEVNSPADGVVIQRRGKLGQPVTPAISDLLQIAVDPPVLEVVAGIQSQMAARIHPGQTVEIEIASVPSPTAGTVRELKSGQVFIDIPNPSPGIARGMAVHIKIK
jgi:multidrug resistance efflux pump